MVVNAGIVIAINNEDKDKVREFLEGKFNPNSIIRKKPIIAYIHSRNMLDLFLSYGLDLTENCPIVKSRPEVFRALISGNYDIDIFSEYNNVTGWKQRDLTKLLREKRERIDIILSNTVLTSDMKSFMADLLYPRPRILTPAQ